MLLKIAFAITRKETVADLLITIKEDDPDHMMMIEETEGTVKDVTGVIEVTEETDVTATTVVPDLQCQTENVTTTLVAITVEVVVVGVGAHQEKL